MASATPTRRSAPGEEGEPGDGKRRTSSLAQQVAHRPGGEEGRDEHGLGEDPQARRRPDRPLRTAGLPEHLAGIARPEELIPQRLDPAQGEHRGGEERRSDELPSMAAVVHEEPDRRRPGDGESLVGVREVGLQDEARRQDQPRQGPALAHPRRCGEPQRAPHRQDQSQLLAGLDQHQAALVELEQHGRRHRSDDADRADDASADEPDADDRGDVGRRHAGGGPPVRVELGERGEHVELQRAEVVEPRADLPRPHRPRSDKRVVRRRHVAGAHREVGGIEQRDPVLCRRPHHHHDGGEHGRAEGDPFGESPAGR